VAKLAAKNSSILDALLPKEVIPTHSLARLNIVNLKTRVLQALADKCHQHVFSCVTKQWNETTDTRLALYDQAYKDLSNLVNDLDQATDVTLYDNSSLVNFENTLEAIYKKSLRPAEKLTAFTFTFNISVLNWYDNYADPPPYGTNGLIATFTIDPNHEDTVGTAVTMTSQPHLDDGHSNCRHFYGTFHANYQAGVLSVHQYWNRICGSSGSTPTVKFYPGGDTEGSTDYDETLRTKYSINVIYGSESYTGPEYCTAMH